MKKSQKIAIITPFIWGVVCFLFFQFFYPYHLFHREQMQLFLFEPGYLLSYFTKPAALACLIGDFLTQFFYYIGGGAATITFVLLLLIVTGYWTFKKVFGRLPALLIILFVATWEAFRNTGLVYPLSSSIALIGGFFVTGVSFLFKQKRITEVILHLFLLAISYWLFGYGAWILLAFLLINKKQKRFDPATLLYLGILFLPLLLRPYYLLTVSQAYKYPMNSFFNYPDTKEEAILEMDVEGSWGNWDKVFSKSQEVDLKIPEATYYHNLSSSHLNQLPENLMDYYQPGGEGLFMKLGPKSSFLPILFSNEVWFWIGDMTMTEHSAMLGQIFSYNHRSSRMVKRLAEINLIAGEDNAADKYLTILEHTLCYKKWAEIRRPGNQTVAIKEWINRKRLSCSSVDTLRYNNDVVISLRNLLDNNPENKAARDYLLCFQLLTKDISGFFDDYNTYVKPLSIIPCKLYTEALMINLARKNTTAVEYASYYLDKSVADDFWHYTQLYEKGDTKALEEKYKKTYWFYYHFATMKEVEK